MQHTFGKIKTGRETIADTNVCIIKPAIKSKAVPWEASKPLVLLLNTPDITKFITNATPKERK
jgi:hypothetical protein